MFLLSNDSLGDCPPLEDPASTSFEMAFVGDVGTLRQTAQQAQFYLSNYDKKRFFKKQLSSNQCGLLVLQNMFQSAALTNQDMHADESTLGEAMEQDPDAALFGKKW